MDNTERSNRENELGALWRKRGTDKPDFFTGSCVCPHCNVKTDIVVFENGFRRGDNHPEYRILKSKPREEGRPSTRRDEAQYQRPQNDQSRGGYGPNDTQERLPAPRPASVGQRQDYVRPVDAFERETRQPLRRQATGPAPQADWTDSVPPVITDEDIPF